jgi:hypothetical protein
VGSGKHERLEDRRRVRRAAGAVAGADGAPLGTGTTMELEVTGAVWNVLPNEYLSGVMHKNLERVGGFTYTAEERDSLRRSGRR